MSTKAGVGFSCDADSKKAGMEACQEAIKDIGNPDLVVVFSTVAYDQQQLLSGVRETAADSLLIGCSDAGHIVNSESITGGVSVMALSSDSIKFYIGQGGKISQGAKEAGSKLAKDIFAKTQTDPQNELKCLIMLTDVLTGNGADIVRGIQDAIGKNALIIGGAAGDDFKFKETFVYYNDEVLPSSLVGVGLSGQCNIGVGVRHGWIPIGLPKKVTKSHGAVLEELDGKPAISIYEEHFGKKAQELRQEPLATLAITYPLGMSVEGNEELLIRAPITVDANGAITCAAEIPEGADIRLMIGSKDDAIAAARNAAEAALKQLGGNKPKAIMVFNCIARNKLFGRHSNEEIQAIRSILGQDVPTIGFYTYGEQAPLGGNLDLCFSCFHNETVVILAIGD